MTQSPLEFRVLPTGHFFLNFGATIILVIFTLAILPLFNLTDPLIPTLFLRLISVEAENLWKFSGFSLPVILDDCSSCWYKRSSDVFDVPVAGSFAFLRANKVCSKFSESTYAVVTTKNEMKYEIKNVTFIFNECSRSI